MSTTIVTIVFVLAAVSAWTILALIGARVLGAMIHNADGRDSVYAATPAPTGGNLP